MGKAPVLEGIGHRASARLDIGQYLYGSGHSSAQSHVTLRLGCTRLDRVVTANCDEGKSLTTGRVEAARCQVVTSALNPFAEGGGSQASGPAPCVVVTI